KTRNHRYKFRASAGLLGPYRVAAALHAFVEDRAVHAGCSRQRDRLRVVRLLAAKRHVVIEPRLSHARSLVDPLRARASRQRHHAHERRRTPHHSMTRSARCSRDEGTVTGSARAARRLTMSSRRSARRTPRSAGLAPRKIWSTSVAACRKTSAQFAPYARRPPASA